MDVKSTYSLNNGRKIPILGFGTWRLTSSESVKAVSHALKSGYRLIDTAAYYQNEAEVGKAIRESKIHRKDVFVTTKLWNSDHSDPKAAFEKSLAALGLEYIDLYLIHWPVPERNESWKVLEGLLDSGKVKSIGVSNFTIRHLDELLDSASIVPAVNQVEFTPYLYQKELLDYCKKKGIRLEAYAPLTRGSKLADPLLSEIASKHKKTAAQVILRWSIQHGVIPLPKSEKPARIAENAALFDFQLDDKDMAMLDSLDEGLRMTWDPEEMK
ncbi:MAG: aldo/keto reductase [Candidatus Micrarchaeia archaeon]